MVNALEKIDKQTNLLTTNSSFQSCIKFEHYSSFCKLLKHIAWILKLNKNYFQNIRHVECQNISLKKLDPKDIKLAEYKVYRDCQFRILCDRNQLSKGKVPFRKG